MIHRPRFHPPPHIYPPDEWNLTEKRFMPDLLEQGETMFALGNGYLGMRGVSRKVDPSDRTGPSLMASTKLGRSSIPRKPTAWRRPVKRS